MNIRHQGMGCGGWMGPMARAASISGTASRVISQPAAASRLICFTVASTSSVGVLHMDWMLTGAPPPTAGTLPTQICLCHFHPPPKSSLQKYVVEHAHHQHQQQQSAMPARYGHIPHIWPGSDAGW